MPDQYFVVDLNTMIAIIFMMGMTVGLLAHRAIKDLIQMFKWGRKHYTDYDVLLEPHKVKVPKQ